MAITLAAALLFSAAPLPERFEGPRAVAPQVVVLLLLPDGTPVIHQHRHRLDPVEKTEEVQEGMNVLKRKSIVMVGTYWHEEFIVDGTNLQVFELNGKRLEPTELRGRIKVPTPALLATDGVQVDRFFLRMAKEGTLVLVCPSGQPVRTEPKKLK